MTLIPHLLRWTMAKPKKQQLDKYDAKDVPPGKIPDWLIAGPAKQPQEQAKQGGLHPIRPNEGLGEYLIRTGMATRRSVPTRTLDERRFGDMNSDITDPELEDWFISLGQKPHPEHEKFKENLAAVLDEPVFTGAPKDPDADGYVPMNFDTWFSNTITPLVWDKTGVSYEAAEEVKEQVLARLMGETHDYTDPDIQQYTNMVLDNLREGQTIDEFPAMSESEAAEAQQKYGDNARFYIGRDNQENYARRRAYGLAQTFANGEHAPPGVGVLPAALSAAGAGIYGLMDFFTTSKDDSDSNDGGENARLAKGALNGIDGRLEMANYWAGRSAENPELAFDRITGANYADKSGTNFTGLGDKMAKSDGYYQYQTNKNRAFFGNPSASAEEKDALYQHERNSNRTTPIVPDSVLGDPEQFDNRAEAAKLFEGYKEASDEYLPSWYARLIGDNPTQFQRDVMNAPKEIISDPFSAAITAGGLGLSMLKGGLTGGLRGAMRAVPVALGRVAEEVGEEAVEGAGIGGGLGGFSYFTDPVGNNILTGDAIPQNANAYKAAFEAGLLEQESNLRRAKSLMQPK